MHKELAGADRAGEGPDRSGDRAAEGSRGDRRDHASRQTAPPIRSSRRTSCSAKCCCRPARPKEAAEAFEVSLLRMPNRARSLMGAIKAHAAAGNKEKAAERLATLNSFWKGKPFSNPATDVALDVRPLNLPLRQGVILKVTGAIEIRACMPSSSNHAARRELFGARHPWCANAQPEERRSDAASGAADRFHGRQRIRQVFTRLRHHLRGRAAALRRVAVGLRAPVPRADGEARRRSHRRHLPVDRHPPEEFRPQSALDGRHRHRDSRLHAPALRARRPDHLPQVRPGSDPRDRGSRHESRCWRCPKARA